MAIVKQTYLDYASTLVLNALLPTNAQNSRSPESLSGLANIYANQLATSVGIFPTATAFSYLAYTSANVLAGAIAKNAINSKDPSLICDQSIVFAKSLLDLLGITYTDTLPTIPTSSDILGTLLTGFVSGPNAPVEAGNTLLQGLQRLQAQISAASAPVTSVFTRTGAVTAQSGDYTTAQVTEVTNLYFTVGRVLAAIGSGTTGQYYRYDNTFAQIQYSELSGLPYYIYQSITTGSVTGTVSETLLISVQVPARASTDMMTVRCMMAKSTTSATFTQAFYFAPTNSLSGATKFATGTTAAAANRSSIMSRTVSLRSSTSSQVVVSPTTSALSEEAGISGVISTLSFDMSSAFYVIAACTLGSVSDTVTAYWLTVEIKRA